jgi:hypothetical protein
VDGDGHPGAHARVTLEEDARAERDLVRGRAAVRGWTHREEDDGGGDREAASEAWSAGCERG